MPKSPYVDFKMVKASVSILQILDHYQLTDTFKRNGDSLTGPCPLHGGHSPTQFRVCSRKIIEITHQAFAWIVSQPTK